MLDQKVTKHAHQRMAYYDLKEFLEHPPEGCRIAVLTGVRRIGKSGVLTDLSATLPNTQYVNFSRNSDTVAARQTCSEFLKCGNGILLVDEITQFPKYEALVETIERIVYSSGDLRVVFTGASSLHLLALKGGTLGAGRAKLFRMSFFNFCRILSVYRQENFVFFQV